jgi:hypothetical protein
MPFAFASFATLGFVLEILVVEEVLFSRCKYKFRSAIHALEDAILKIRHSSSVPYQLERVRMTRRGFLLASAPPQCLFHFPARFLPVPFAGQRLLGPALLSRLQVERMAFDFFNDVFLLHLSLEAPKGVF